MGPAPSLVHEVGACFSRMHQAALQRAEHWDPYHWGRGLCHENGSPSYAAEVSSTNLSLLLIPTLRPLGCFGVLRIAEASDARQKTVHDLACQCLRFLYLPNPVHRYVSYYEALKDVIRPLKGF